MMSDDQRANLRSWLKWMTLTLGVIAAGFMGTWVYNARLPQPWDPLYGPLSGQQITGQTADYVIVRGQKCSSADGPILIRGNVFAQQVSPIGSPSPVGNTGVAVRLPGCTPHREKVLARCHRPFTPPVESRRSGRPCGRRHLQRPRRDADRRLTRHRLFRVSDCAPTIELAVCA